MRESTIPLLLLLILFFLLCHGTPANGIAGIENFVSNVLKSYMQKCKQLDILKWDANVLNLNQPSEIPLELNLDKFCGATSFPRDDCFSMDRPADFSQLHKQFGVTDESTPFFGKVNRYNVCPLLNKAFSQPNNQQILRVVDPELRTQIVDIIRQLSTETGDVQTGDQTTNSIVRTLLTALPVEGGELSFSTMVSGQSSHNNNNGAAGQPFNVSDYLRRTDEASTTSNGHREATTDDQEEFSFHTTANAASNNHNDDGTILTEKAAAMAAPVAQAVQRTAEPTDQVVSMTLKEAADLLHQIANFMTKFVAGIRPNGVWDSLYSKFRGGKEACTFLHADANRITVFNAYEDIVGGTLLKPVFDKLEAKVKLHFGEEKDLVSRRSNANCIFDMLFSLELHKICLALIEVIQIQKKADRTKQNLRTKMRENYKTTSVEFAGYIQLEINKFKTLTTFEQMHIRVQIIDDHQQQQPQQQQQQHDNQQQQPQQQQQQHDNQQQQPQQQPPPPPANSSDVIAHPAPVSMAPAKEKFTVHFGRPRAKEFFHQMKLLREQLQKHDVVASPGSPSRHLYLHAMCHWLHNDKTVWDIFEQLVFHWSELVGTIKQIERAFNKSANNVAIADNGGKTDADYHSKVEGNCFYHMTMLHALLALTQEMLTLLRQPTMHGADILCVKDNQPTECHPQMTELIREYGKMEKDIDEWFKFDEYRWTRFRVERLTGTFHVNIDPPPQQQQQQQMPVEGRHPTAQAPTASAAAPVAPVKPVKELTAAQAATFFARMGTLKANIRKSGPIGNMCTTLDMPPFRALLGLPGVDTIVNEFPGIKEHTQDKCPNNLALFRMLLELQKEIWEFVQRNGNGTDPELQKQILCGTEHRYCSSYNNSGATLFNADYKLFASAIDNWFYSATTNNSAWEELKRLLIVDKFAVHIPTDASARNAAASTSSSASSAAAAAASGHSTPTDEVLLGQLAKRTNRLEWLSRQMHNKMVEKQFDWDMSAGQHESLFLIRLSPENGRQLFAEIRQLLMLMETEATRLANQHQANDICSVLHSPHQSNNIGELFNKLTGPRRAIGFHDVDWAWAWFRRALGQQLGWKADANHQKACNIDVVKLRMLMQLGLAFLYTLNSQSDQKLKAEFFCAHGNCRRPDQVHNQIEMWKRKMGGTAKQLEFWLIAFLVDFHGRMASPELALTPGFRAEAHFNFWATKLITFIHENITNKVFIQIVGTKSRGPKFDGLMAFIDAAIPTFITDPQDLQNPPYSLHYSQLNSHNGHNMVVAMDMDAAAKFIGEIMHPPAASVNTTATAGAHGGAATAAAAGTTTSVRTHQQHSGAATAATATGQGTTSVRFKHPSAPVQVDVNIQHGLGGGHVAQQNKAKQALSNRQRKRMVRMEQKLARMQNGSNGNGNGNANSSRSVSDKCYISEVVIEIGGDC